MASQDANRSSISEDMNRFFTAPLAESDPEIAGAVKAELGRQRDEIELIASENIVSRAVLEAAGIGAHQQVRRRLSASSRYYGGCEEVDKAEDLAIERAKKLFGCALRQRPAQLRQRRPTRPCSSRCCSRATPSRHLALNSKAAT